MFDVDEDGMLNVAECERAAQTLFPQDEWASELWPELCQTYGADPVQVRKLTEY